MKRRDPRRGGAPLFLLCTLLLSCATGVGVWLYLKDRYHAKVAEATPPPKPTPAPMEARAPEVVPPAAPEPEPAMVAPSAPPVEPPIDPDALPEQLTSAQIETTITAARARFADCNVSGRMTLTLRIRPSGRVEQVTVEGSDSDEMTTCLVTATKRIKFPKSVKGLTARYSLVGE